MVATKAMKNLLDEFGPLDLGTLVCTPTAEEVVGVAGTRYFLRHRVHEWGDLSDLDRESNTEAVRLLHEDPEFVGRVQSAFNHEGTRIWVITDIAPNYRVTTLLLPEDY